MRAAVIRSLGWPAFATRSKSSGAGASVVSPGSQMAPQGRDTLSLPFLASIAMSAAMILSLIAGDVVSARSPGLRLYRPEVSVAADVGGSFVGHGGVSTDGLGQLEGGGTLQAKVPANSRIQFALLYAATVFGGDTTSLTFAGQEVSLTPLANVQNTGIFSTSRADVTAIVKGSIGGRGGIFDFVVADDPTSPLLNGVALVVVYAKSSLPVTSISIYDGGMGFERTTTTLAFGQAVKKTSDFRATLALGIQHGYQGSQGLERGHHLCGTDVAQYSIVDVNSRRLSSCAGNYDDGFGGDGALVTVGGVGDSKSIPSDRFQTPGDGASPRTTDDELYDITDYVKNGDRSLALTTENPSQDDSIFLAVVTVGGKVTNFAATPDAEASTLGFASGAPRFVPADGRAVTSLVATVRDEDGTPLAKRKVRIDRVPETAAERRQAVRAAADDASFTATTDSKGKAVISISDTELGAHRFRLVDVTDDTPIELASPVKVEFTRKVVVLAMGMGSSLDARTDYWGDPDDSSSAAVDTTYEAFKRLGYASATLGDDADVFATLLDSSWGSMPCLISNLDDNSCVATVSVLGDDVKWVPGPYDLGLPQWPDAGGYWKELQVDKWATKLVKTLVTYEQKTYDATKIHTSFYLVGHSMGGQLVVRALDKAIKDPYFTDPKKDGTPRPTRRGMLQAVIALDGAVNWRGVLIPHVRPDVCRKPQTSVAGPDWESDNRNNIDDAKSKLGTVTVVITNTQDLMVPPAVSTIDPKPSSGYKEYLYKGRTGDGCAHSNLKRRQDSGIKAVAGPESQFPFYEVVLRRFVGTAVDE